MTLGLDTHKLREALSLGWSAMDSVLKVRLMAVVGLIAIGATASALTPLVMKEVIDGLVDVPAGTAASAALLVGLYVICHWTSRVLADVRILLLGVIERRLYTTLSERLFSHIMSLPLQFHFEKKTGALGELMTQGIVGFGLILQAIAGSILVVFELATLIGVLLSIDQPVFLGLYGLAVACYAWAFTVGIRRVQTASREAAARQMEVKAAMADGILNYEAVKYFGAEQHIAEQYGCKLDSAEGEWRRLLRREAHTRVVTDSVFIVFLAASLFYAVAEVAAGRMTVGTFTLIATYVLRIVAPVETIGFAFQRMSAGLGFMEQLLQLYKQPPEPAPARLSQVPEVRGELEFDRVAFSYRPERRVLDAASFKVRAGKTVGIVGASGAGKSTIVRLMVRLLDPQEGRILLDGQDVATMAPAALRQLIAVVPQDTIIFNDTIAYNIAFGRPASAQEIERAAQLAQLHDFIAKLPEGYHTRVGERGMKLSGGERQRLSVARAVLKRPRIYVFDEATSSLDSHTEREVLRSFGAVSRGCTTLIIAHRLSTVIHADEIVVLEGGSVLERGAHQDLIRCNGKYAALWRIQQSTEGVVMQPEPAALNVS